MYVYMYVYVGLCTVLTVNNRGVGLFRISNWEREVKGPGGRKSQWGTMAKPQYVVWGR